MLSALGEVVVNDFAKTERQIRDEMNGGNHFENRQSRDVGHDMRAEIERRRRSPGFLDGDIGEVIAHQLADPRRGIDMRNDLDQEIRLRQRGQKRPLIDGLVLVTHRSRRAEDAAVMQRADDDFTFVDDLRIGELLRKAPDLAAAGDRRVVIEIHGMDIAARLSAISYRNDLPRLRVVAEAGGIGHADELVFHQRLVDFERRRHHGLQRLACRAVGDDDVFAVEEPIGSRRIGRIGQRHRIGMLENVFDLHRIFRRWSKQPGAAAKACTVA
ncbi:hypothetical protein RHSP_58650 [Rhizobium freirei PRF 81]|uniref:Uncharacterized protein n=1 Tax=Rhizobium freirei PRF 81 TaxID=363754 RepID=N6V1H4_9HYPH|nr:hypothetical protein RHSP_58650 [Rhizobium freirei PRF 81]